MSIIDQIIKSWDHINRQEKMFLTGVLEREARIPMTLAVLTHHLVLRVWLRKRGYQNWEALLRFGSAEHILAFTVLFSDALKRWNGLTTGRWTSVHSHVSFAFERLSKDDGATPNRVQVFSNVIVAMLDQGLSPAEFARTWSLKRFLAIPTIYQRLIDSMSEEDLNGSRNSYGGSQGPVWFWLLTSGPANAPTEARRDRLLDQVVRLRAKGVDVSSQRLLFGDGQGWNDSDRIGPALIDVENELRRREGAMLMDLADTVLVVAAGDETAQPYERKRL
jgi:hypothetical protein